MQILGETTGKAIIWANYIHDINTIESAIKKELIPFSIDSFPREGPIISDWIISADAGNLPALNTFAKSIASFNEKLFSLSAIII